MRKMYERRLMWLQIVWRRWFDLRWIDWARMSQSCCIYHKSSLLSFCYCCGANNWSQFSRGDQWVYLKAFHCAIVLHNWRRRNKHFDVLLDQQVFMIWSLTLIRGCLIFCPNQTIILQIPLVIYKYIKKMKNIITKYDNGPFPLSRQNSLLLGYS